MDANLAIFDADEHYYEAEDAFTRHADKRMTEQRFVRWMTEADGKRRRLYFGAREANVIGNPTFSPVAVPGVYHETLRQLEVSKDRTAAAYGKLEPIRPAYRDREVRLKTMDEQGVDKTLLFPTLGVTIEGFINDDVPMLYSCFQAFNRWLEDDWGYAYRGRLFAAPYISMLDLGHAVAELDRLLERGARIITIRPGPAYGRSPADPYFDPFWARINEAGVLVAYHAYEGPSSLTESYDRQWAAPPQPRLPEHTLLQRLIAGQDAAIVQTLAALVLHNLFGRFPNIRVATIELGASWLPYLLGRLDHAGGLVNRRITAFGSVLSDRPSEIFRRHVWVAPFPEEDVAAVARQIGVEHVLMGSDWPHAEATPQPRDYLRCLAGFDEQSVRRIVHDNAQGLMTA